MRTTKYLTLAAVFLAALPVLRAEEPMVLPLWTNGAPGFENRRDEPEVAHDYWVRNINNPSLTVFLPPKEKANGAAVLICPGGGFRELVFQAEGVAPAHYFNDLGVAAFVLKYRLPRETNSPYSLEIHPRQDGQRAMRLIRSHAAEWNLDTSRIGVIGFSAGGEVESLLVYSPAQGDPAATDPVDRFDSTVNFQMVIYPGPLGIPEELPADAPPAFFLIANDDVGHMGAVLSLVNKYHAARRPFELHVFERGGHGFNMGGRSKLVSIKDWPQRMTDWMKDSKIIPGTP
jgi:acetyl esterase/lipase